MSFLGTSMLMTFFINIPPPNALGGTPLLKIYALARALGACTLGGTKN